ncbi:MAG: uroporphyrinogen-III synthase [Planctomycetota bacterium]
MEGRRVLVTRPRAQASSLLALLEERGAEGIPFPTVEIRPVADLSALDASIARLPEFDWIAFTSAGGVAVFFDRLAAAGLGLPASLRIAVVGPATERALVERGARAALVPREFRGERLAEEIPDVEGRRVLFPRAAIAREALAEGLRRRGALVEDPAVYDTLPAQPDARGLRELERGLDAATFTSASTARNFVLLLGDRAARLLEGALVACIGPTTAAEARGLRLPVHVEPPESTVEALVAALAEAFESRRAAERTRR